jgi:hypothetical protein
LTRKKVNPADSLARFMIGIYDYYVDRGMAKKTAKARMVDNTLEECVKLIKSEEEIPDHMLVIMTQYMSRALNNRGAQITKLIEMKYPTGTLVPEDAVIPLRDIKTAKDEMDRFIETYKGWSELDGGTKKES